MDLTDGTDPTDRSRDQMVQAARSGRHNIAEGSRAADVSSKSEIRPTSVARASLDELLLDYENLSRSSAVESLAAVFAPQNCRQAPRAGPNSP